MLLDSDRTGLIDIDEFVQGCMQLHGPAKSMQARLWGRVPFGPIRILLGGFKLEVLTSFRVSLLSIIPSIPSKCLAFWLCAFLSPAECFALNRWVLTARSPK